MTHPIPENDRIVLNALVDGELDAAATAALETRLATDTDLAAVRDEIVASREAVSALPRPTVSAAFLWRIEALAEPAVPPVAPPVPVRTWWEGWRNIAASVLLTALVAGSATWFLAAPRGPGLEDLIAASHRRSLLANTPVDILSSDRHTVKPWLDGRLGISPPAPDLAAQGYPLFGGRVEVLGQQAVPTLVYHHNEHTISVVARPGSSATAAPKNLASDGYNMVEWSGNGFDFTAVSDLEPDELSAFVSDYRTAAGP